MAPFGAALIVVLAAGVAVVVARWLNVALDPAQLVAPERVPFLGGGGSETHAWSRFHVRYWATG